MGVVANAAEARGPRHRAGAEGQARQIRAERGSSAHTPSIADGTAEIASGERR